MLLVGTVAGEDALQTAGVLDGTVADPLLASAGEAAGMLCTVGCVASTAPPNCARKPSESAAAPAAGVLGCTAATAVQEGALQVCADETLAVLGPAAAAAM